MSQPEEWFSTWFDSPYYHMLYSNRNYAEAEQFLQNLLQHLHPKPDAKILDLACGKGRHAIYLNQQGYNVTGVDLAPQSIAAAKQFENEKLHFEVHDMREPFKPNHFDFVLNLFTSFGYFASETENVVALKAIAESVKPGGKLVIDFLNAEKVVANLVPQETKVLEGITFHITKRMEGKLIVKTIDFEAEGKPYHFQEKVWALTTEDFHEYFKMTDLRLHECFGSYKLEPFDAKTSDRLIFILKK
ncbi:class I SAM-dependent methyltransferase [Adhaeribacter sp. BT258]|uniref:Class I SAM-dependent methyltransferase n=1 Tax=Adhaeribacter terrigena TaxID=2793070 RepID=A0ABS1C2W3_9BACT|nr:class I SAM-dependent methyltransferase [Adhaeribacter terrigena]MBK0403658.1 class I SAM-dependent methyltransferase [Adhaeribacter terrigena]